MLLKDENRTAMHVRIMQHCIIIMSKRLLLFNSYVLCSTPLVRQMFGEEEDRNMKQEKVYSNNMLEFESIAIQIRFNLPTKVISLVTQLLKSI